MYHNTQDLSSMRTFVITYKTYLQGKQVLNTMNVEAYDRGHAAGKFPFWVGLITKVEPKQ